jgi:hypothetical protein
LKHQRLAIARDALDGAAAGRQQAVKQAQQGAFTAAVGADQGDPFTGFDTQADAG